MFTGIIKEQGSVRMLRRMGAITRMEIESGLIKKTASIGDSVAVNGVCLTVAEKKGPVIVFDVMDETVRRSNLVEMSSGACVNMEDALRADSFLGGHFVQGHIDCVGNIKVISEKKEDRMIHIEIPRQFNRLIVDKGSITVDGVSLTVGDALDGSFTVYLIPHTLKSTNLGARKRGDKLNIEFDIIGKYIARFNDFRSSSNLTEEYLRQKGFV